MTKAEALADFKENILPEIKKTEAKYGNFDRVMRAEEWGIYTDSLCKDKQITLKQYESWTNPF